MKDPIINENNNDLIDAAKLYIPSAYGGFKRRHLWQDIEIFCQFLGYPRSGHSLVGALLNAHPNIVMSHESDALKYVYAGFTKYQVYDLIFRKAIVSAEKDYNLGGYNYHVPNQWQGRIKKLKVIGDKKGARTTLRIGASSRYISRLRIILNNRLKFIHVVRNPFDNITTISRKSRKLKESLELSIENYFYLCKIINDFKATLKPEELIEFKHEDFIENPQLHLKKLCHFLEVEAPIDYLNDCANIVYESPHRSRDRVSWSPEQIEFVMTQINKFSFLQGYSYYD